MPGPDDLSRNRGGIVRAVVLAVDDTGVAQTLTVQTHDGVVRSGVEVASIHGLSSHASAGGETVLLAIEGDQTHYVALPVGLFGFRFGALPAGGAALYDDAGNRLVFPGNGTGTITTAGLFTLLVQSLMVQTQGGTTFRGPVTFTDPVVFEAGVTFQKDVSIGGGLTVAGGVSGAGFDPFLRN